MSNEYAWVRLCRLCGCNYRLPVERSGKSLWVPQPQRFSHRFRLDPAKWDAGKVQIRDGWAISPWSEEAEITRAREQG